VSARVEMRWGNVEPRQIGAGVSEQEHSGERNHCGLDGPDIPRVRCLKKKVDCLVLSNPSR